MGVERFMTDAVYECMPAANISHDVLEPGNTFAVLPIPDVTWNEFADPILARAC